ncbi:MAG TPA: lysozyme inhibitor LprI family protein, partial [Bryobacteraceae bacterium]
FNAFSVISGEQGRVMSFSSRWVKWGLVGVALVAVLVAAWWLTGFGKKTEIQCSSPDAMSTTIDVLKKGLEKEIQSKTNSVENADAVSKSSIRAAIAQLVVTFEDVRTTRQDPNSTKRFCEGTLKIRFPAEDLSNADEARSAAGLGTVTQLADSNDVDREADTFSAKTDYDVQPTDTGDKVFAETETKSPLMNVASEVLASSLLHNVLQQAAAAQQQQQQAQQTQQNAAVAEQKAADLNSAKVDNQLAMQSILAVWRAIPAPVRTQLLPQQRAWVRKKDADCRVEAASASTDPTDIEVARLKCDTAATQERINFLQPYREQTPDSTSQQQSSGE